jgi:hypothetical protein
MSIGDQRIDIIHGVAYETIKEKELWTMVFLSDQPLPVDELKTILARDQGSDGSFNPVSRFLKLSFESDGEPSQAQVNGINRASSLQGWNPTSKVVLKDGVVEGVSRYQGPDGLGAHFDVQFRLTVIPLPEALKKKLPGATVAKTCEGSMSLHGKSFPLSYAVVYPYTDPFGVQYTRVLLSKKPVPLEELQVSLSKADGGIFGYFEPHLTLDFDAQGKLMVASGYAENKTVSHMNGTNDEPWIVGSLKSADGKREGDAESKAIPAMDDRQLRLQFRVKYCTSVVLSRPKENTDPPAKQARRLR